MVQDIRKRLFIVIGLGAGLLLALILGIVALRDRNQAPAQEETVAPSDETTTTNQGAPPPNVGAAPETSTQATGEPEDIYLQQLAGLFVERFGSYSTQNDNSHIDDVLPLVTPRMGSYLERQRQEFTREYSGVTTRVVAARIVQKTAAAATVAVDVQRVITDGGMVTTAYASATVQLERIGADWKIDGLFWQ